LRPLPPVLLDPTLELLLLNPQSHPLTALIQVVSCDAKGILYIFYFLLPSADEKNSFLTSFCSAGNVTAVTFPNGCDAAPRA
jgi:hypothetical protein